MAASLSLQSNFSLNSILENCCWTAHSTFSSFYLRDMSTQTGELFSLGPLVAAGQIIISKEIRQTESNIYKYIYIYIYIYI